MDLIGQEKRRLPSYVHNNIFANHSNHKTQGYTRILQNKSAPSRYYSVFIYEGVEGVVRGLEGIHLADRCVLTKLQ
jgi:hypothetical protein